MVEMLECSINLTMFNLQLVELYFYVISVTTAYLLYCIHILIVAEGIIYSVIAEIFYIQYIFQVTL